MKRLPAALSVALLLTLGLAAPTLAAPPSNDLWEGRTVVGALPYSETLDTSEATTDANDAQANESCGAPATDASVWYELTVPTDMGVAVDVSESSYSAGVLVLVGSPGSFETIACAPGAVGFFAEAGQTYYLLAIDDQFDGGGNGGTLVINIFEAPPPPEIDITVNPVGSFNPRTGSATISGTATCTGDVDFAFIDIFLQQRVGRFLINGFGSMDIACDETVQPWSVEVFGETGSFKGGQALAVTFGIACGVFDCGFDFEERTVKLRR